MGVLLRCALAKLEPTLRANCVGVTYGDLPRISGEPDRLAQVFEELLCNAASHKGDLATKVHISATSETGHCLFRVTDSRPGVEAGELHRIFLPFDRLNGTGAGLGLAGAKGISNED